MPRAGSCSANCYNSHHLPHNPPNHCSLCLCCDSTGLIVGTYTTYDLVVHIFIFYSDRRKMGSLRSMELHIVSESTGPSSLYFPVFTLSLLCRSGVMCVVDYNLLNFTVKFLIPWLYSHRFYFEGCCRCKNKFFVLYF